MEEKIKDNSKSKTVINTKLYPKKISDRNEKRHSSNKRRFSLVLDTSVSTRVKRFESLINIKDDSIINTSESKHNTTFTINPRIKKILLKDYKHTKKKEKKYRRIRIIPNLIDSSQSSEESSEDDGDIGVNIFIPSESYFILIFDSLLLFFSLFSVLFIPLHLAERKYFCKEENILYKSFQLITEILFIIDLIISFFRSYYNYEYKKITLTYKIIKYYLKHGFFLDFISAFPSYTINKKLCNERNYYSNKYSLTTKEIIGTVILFLKVFKVLKVLSHKKNKFIELLYEKTSDNLFFEQILNTSIYSLKIFSFLHSLICCHIFIGEQRTPNWMIHINIQNENLLVKYLSSFYFLIETLTTVGYGDVICISSIEIFFQLILLSIGIVSYSFIITKFGNYINTRRKEEIELQEKKIQLEQIRIQYPSMPFKLYIKIQDFLVKKSYKKANKKNEIKNLVNNLPEQLRNEMLLIINKDIIDNFIIFKDCKNTDFIIKIISCFTQTICRKESILIKEGDPVENIIFVKDGRLILEATIDLIKPFDSYKKYFTENFKYLKDKPKNKPSLSSQNTTNNPEDNNNLDKLKKRLNYAIEGVKVGVKNNTNLYVNNRKSSVLLQMDLDKSSEEKEKSENDGKNEEKGKFQYLKILDIRKNEHFGNIFMFLEKPAPLTLIVKSKIAELFIVRKKDAMMINNIHHNIVKRINEKSFKNLLSIRKKTLQVLKKFFELNNYKKENIQDKSWFNEKSKDIMFHDITNFINNSILKSDKNNISGSIINLSNPRTVLNESNFKKRFSQASIKFIDKKNTGNKSMNYLSSNWIPKERKSINVIKSSVITNLNKNYIPQLIMEKRTNINLNANNFINTKSQTIEKNNSNPLKGSQTNNTSSKLLLTKIYNNKPKITSKFNVAQKTTNKELTDQESLDLTMEEEMITLNSLKNDVNEKLRKKIKASVKKDKILKLNKAQNNMINSFQEEIKNSLINDLLNSKLLDNFNKIRELNKILYNNLIEFFETDCETDEEKPKIEPIKNKNQLIIDKTININIEASYYNLNNITKGKIIKNDKYREEIKYLIEKYIKTKKKYSLSLINEFIKLYANKSFSEQENIIKKNLTKNENNGIPHIDNLSLVFNNIINENTTKNKKKLVQKFPKHARTKNNGITTPKFVSYQIKKTKTNNKDFYKNFKNYDYERKSSHLKLDNKNLIKKNFKTNSNIKNNIDNNLNDDKEDDDSSNIFAKMINKFFSRLK